jgi:hypothetical protein
MIKLLFANPSFRRGLQTTVRLGQKYAKGLNIGEAIMLCNLKGYVIDEATVSYIHSCTINNLPSEMLKLEHDTKCARVEGLLDVLRNAYDGITDEPISYQTVITVIGFTI